MGFCFYVGHVEELLCMRQSGSTHSPPQNNVAVAAAYLRTIYKDSIKRVLILDW